MFGGDGLTTCGLKSSRIMVVRHDMGIYESCIVASRLRGGVKEAGDSNLRFD